MPKKLAFVGLIALLCASAASAQGDFIDSQALLDADLVKYWQLPLPLQSEQELVAVYLVDDQLYAVVQDGYVYALDAKTGVIRWVKQVTTAGYEIRRPCHHGRLTIFVLPPTLVQYDRYSGQPIRRGDMRFPSGTPAVSDGVRFYIGGIDQKIYAFLPGQDFEVWKARAEGQIISQPALMGENLFFADDGGNVFSCVAADKRFQWRSRKIGSVTADLAVDLNGVYAAARDYSLYLLSPEAGHLRWRMRFSGPLVEPPVITPEIVFQYCREDGVTAINPNADRESRKMWTVTETRGFLTLDDKSAYLLGRDENIHVVNLDDGKSTHMVPSAGFTMFAPTTETTAMFLAAKDGKLFCARKRGVPVLLASDVKKAAAGPATASADDAEDAASATDAAEADGDVLTSKRPGPPIGGKSKVTKEYAGE